MRTGSSRISQLFSSAVITVFLFPLLWPHSSLPYPNPALSHLCVSVCCDNSGGRLQTDLHSSPCFSLYDMCALLSASERRLRDVTSGRHAHMCLQIHRIHSAVSDLLSGETTLDWTDESVCRDKCSLSAGLLTCCNHILYIHVDGICYTRGFYVFWYQSEL